MPQQSDDSMNLFLVHGGGSRQIPTTGISSITIGRSDECTVTLDIAKISRVHAEIRIDGQDFRLIDKRSSNGTYLNGERIESARLRAGDRIEIGEAVIEVRSPQAKTVRKNPAKKRPATSGTKGSRGANTSSGKKSAVNANPDEENAYVPRRSGPSALNRVADITLMILLLVLVGLVAKEYATGPKKIVREVQPQQETDSTNADVTQIAGPMDDGEVSLKLLEQEMADGEMGWDAIDGLRSIARRQPSSRAAKTCLDLAEALEGVKSATQLTRREALEELLTPMVLAQEFGNASVVARFLATVDSGDASRKYWTGRADQIGRMARAEIRTLDEQVTSLLNLRKPGEALRLVAASRQRLAGFNEFEGMLTDLVEGMADLKLKEPPRRVKAPREWSELLARSRRYLEECRYSDLSPVLYRALSLDLPPNDHIQALDLLVKAGALTAMFEEFIEGAAGGELEVRVAGVPMRVLRATRESVELQRTIAGGKQNLEKSWLEVTSTDKSSLFRAVPHSVEGVMGLVFLAEIAGDDEGFHRALVNLHAQEWGESCRSDSHEGPSGDSDRIRVCRVRWPIGDDSRKRQSS